MFNKKFIKTIAIISSLCFFQAHPEVKAIERQTADLIIISENNPKHLREMVESVFKYAPDIQKVYVLKDPCYGQYRDLYNSIKADYDQVEFIKVGPSNFKSMLESIINLDHNRYVLLSRSNIIFTSPVDIDGCIKAMNRVKTDYLCLTLYKNIQEKQLESLDIQAMQNLQKEETQENQKTSYDNCLQENLDTLEKEIIEESTAEQDNIFMWQFKSTNANTLALNMTIYKKSGLINTIQQLNYTCPQELLDCKRNN